MFKERQASGWKRDLTVEGIEPNPGPTWDELMDAISKKFRGGVPDPVTRALSEIYREIVKLKPTLMFVDTKAVLEYLDGSTVAPQLIDLIEEAIRQLEAAAQVPGEPQALGWREVSEIKWLNSEKVKQRLAGYNTTFQLGLLKLQCTKLGPCLKKSLAPSSDVIEAISPQFLEPFGTSHSDLLQKILAAPTAAILLYNASGAGKTKMAFLLSLLSLGKEKRQPIAILITVGQLMGSTTELTIMFEKVAEKAKAITQLSGSTFAEMNRVDTEVRALFKCIETAHIVCLAEFLDITTDNTKTEVSELWLRFIQNGGQSAINDTFEALLRLKPNLVQALFTKATRRVHEDGYIPVFFYDEVTALCEKVKGCCKHAGYTKDEEALPIWLLDKTDGHSPNHIYATDLFYALRKEAAASGEIHIFADANQTVLQELVSKRRSPTMPVAPFSQTVYVTQTMMEQFLDNHFDYNKDKKLKIAISRLVGRPRHFFDFYLPTVTVAMKQKPPQNKQQMTKILIAAASEAERTLVSRFVNVVRSQHNDATPIPGSSNSSPHSMMMMCLEALCLKDSKLEVKSSTLRDLVTTNIIMARGNPFKDAVDEVSVYLIDLREEPIIQKAIETHYFGKFPSPDNDPIFGLLHQRLGVMHLSDSAKGDLGDRAMAWAFCRMARQYKNLGEALQAVLPTGTTIPKRVFECTLNPKLFCGPSNSANPKNFMEIFDRDDPTEIYVFPDTDAGLDGMAFFLNSMGALTVQSKVRVAFNIIQALNTTNPFLVYYSQEDRKLALDGYKAQSAWTKQDERMEIRTTIHTMLEKQLVVRVLFSAGGFEAAISKSVTKWNEKNADEPIILITPTKELFGKMLSSSLQHLSSGTLKNVGKTTIKDYFPLVKPLSSDSNLLSQDDWQPPKGGKDHTEKAQKKHKKNEQASTEKESEEESQTEKVEKKHKKKEKPQQASAEKEVTKTEKKGKVQQKRRSENPTEEVPTKKKKVGRSL